MPVTGSEQQRRAEILGRAFRVIPFGSLTASIDEVLSRWVQAAPGDQSAGREQARQKIRTAYRNRLPILRLDNLALTSLPDCMDLLVTLQFLTVNENRLTDLPNLPAALTNLEVSSNCLNAITSTLPAELKVFLVMQNQLSRLPALPQSLIVLRASQNQLTELPSALPAGLLTLDVSENRLSALPQLPPALLRLAAAKNTLAQLPIDLPETLTELWLSENALSTLPALPAGLTKLIAKKNCLAHLPAILPERLQLLVLNENALVTLPPLPARLTVLVVADNVLTMLPALPPGLRILWASGNHLFDLPELPESLQDLQLAQNPLGRIPRNLRLHIGNRTNTVAMLREWQFSLQPAVAGPHANAATTASSTAQRTLAPGSAAAPELSGPAGTHNRASGTVFNDFLARLNMTAEYQDEALRPGLVLRVRALVAAMGASPALRAICMTLAGEAVTTCGDRIALGLNDMELEKIDDDAARGIQTAESLLPVGEGMFKLQVLNEIAITKIAQLQQDPRIDARRPVDEVEVRLAYHTALKNRLDLPAVTEAMLYRGCSHVCENDIDAAELQVRRQLAGSASVAHLAQWRPWRKAMGRRYPAEHDRLKAVHQDARNAISVLPPRMSEREWMQALAELKADEGAQLDKLMIRLTRQFLAEQCVT